MTSTRSSTRTTTRTTTRSSTTSSPVGPQAALTTIFTPPTFCGPYVDSSSLIYGKDSSRLSSCLPGLASRTSRGGLDDIFFSPAICPLGYTPGCTRWHSSQGPTLSGGETAVICCPSSFKCAIYEDDACVSGPESSSTLAVSVQIRWKSSDLSRFQTPPLTGALPTFPRHSNWDPASSITYPYTFPADCLAITNTWIPFSEKSCAPLTGDYYSPAICPSGWTAAFTRPVLGAGPPVEADETAMLCCPSGFSSLEAACGSMCVSATATSGRYGYSIELLQVRDPVQIRWASSDFSAFQTHPLTPGLILNSPLITFVNPVVPPKGLYQVAIGLALLPFILCCSAAACGALILRRNRKGEQQSLRTATPSASTAYKPRFFSRALLLSLFGFIISVLILLELSCHILPKSEGSIIPKDFAVIKSVLSNSTIIQKRAANDTILNILDNMTCSVVESDGVSIFSTIDRGTSTTITSTRGTTSCSLSGRPVALPSCVPPVGAPKESKWLSSQQGGNSTMILDGSAEGAFFLGDMLPTFIAILFNIPWKVIHMHTTSLQPFRQLTILKTSTVSSTIFGRYDGIRAITSPITLLTSCLVYSSALLTALASEAWNLGLIGSCSENDNSGCLPILQVTPKVVRTMEALLLLVALLTVSLAIMFRSWTSGVFADPRSIIGTASLIQSPELRSLFGSVGMNSSFKAMKKRLGGIRVYLGYDSSPQRHQDYGIWVADTETQRMLPTRPELQPMDNIKVHTNKLSVTRPALLLGIYTMFLLGFVSLVIYYTVTSNDSSFERFMSSQGFGPRFLFTSCGLAINFGWGSIFQATLRLMPYYAMSMHSSRGAEARTSVLVPFSIDPYSGIIYAIKNKSPLIAVLSFSSILSDFLPFFLANVPFQRTTTWDAHLASSWLAIAILCLMILVALTLWALLVFARPTCPLSADLLQNDPLAAAVIVLAQSGGFVQSCRQLSGISTKERDQRIINAELKYYLISDVNSQGRRVFIHSSAPQGEAAQVAPLNQ